jgi:hypothetical protein
VHARAAVRFLQMALTGDDRRPATYRPLATLPAPHPVLCLRWLSDTAVMTLDDQDLVHVYDVRNLEPADAVSLRSANLVFATRFSQLHFDNAHARSYEQTVVAGPGAIYVLGTRTLHTMTLNPWQERIASLVNQSKFVEALELGLAFYADAALAPAGLPLRRKARAAAVRQHLLTLLEGYVDLALATNSAVADAAEFFASVSDVVVPYSLRLDAADLLFSSLYDRFAAIPAARSAFFCTLVPLILEGKVRALSAISMQGLVQHLEDRAELPTLERCLVQLDVSTLDIHAAVALCYAHCLYDGLLYIYSHGLRDFVTPLRELVRQLIQAINEATRGCARPTNAAALLPSSQQRLGYKILLYISHCLAGKAFPSGDLPEEIVPRVQFDVYKLLLSRPPLDGEGGSYPFVRALLQFDTREFLNVLALAFEEPPPDDHDVALPSHQVVVDALLYIMVSEPQQKAGAAGVAAFAPEQLGALFTFLARQMARADGALRVESRLFDVVLEHLTRPDDDAAHHEERQQALLELHSTGGLAALDQARLLRLAEGARFFRVCQLVYASKGEHHRIIDCYLNDAPRACEIFAFAHTTLQSSAVSSAEKSRVVAAVSARFPALLALDPDATARLALADLPLQLPQLVARLADQPAVQYRLLAGLFATRLADGGGSLDPESSAGEPDTAVFTPELHEKLLELMCTHEPTAVYPHLRLHDDYRLRECLAITRRHGITDATAWLLERSGDFSAACALVMETLKSRLASAAIQFAAVAAAGTKYDKSRPDDDPRIQAIAALRAILAVALQTCLRASAQLDEAERAALWFPVLDTFLTAQRSVAPGDEDHAAILRELTRMIVSSMLGLVSLPTILHKILGDNALPRTFGELRGLLQSMLQSYAYEQTLLQTTTSIMGTDVYWALRMRQVAAHKATAPKSRCGVCRRPVLARGKADDAVLFHCGHSFHAPCLGGGSEHDLACYICQASSTLRPGAPSRRGGSDRSTALRHTEEDISSMSLRELDPSASGQPHGDPQASFAKDSSLSAVVS